MPKPAAAPNIATGPEQFAADIAQMHDWEIHELWDAIAAYETTRILSTSTVSSGSVAIGTGDKTFPVPAGLGFVAGQSINVVSTANPANFMTGFVKSYASTTLVVTVNQTGGAGTFASWAIALGLSGGGASLGVNNFSGTQNFAVGSAVASIATVNLTALVDGNIRALTGIVDIGAWTIGNGPLHELVYTGAGLTLLYHATTNHLNSGGANVPIVAGDRLYIKAIAGVVYVHVVKDSGVPVNTAAKIQSVAASVASNNLTASINPFTADFRSSTLNVGVPNSRVLNAVASVVALSGATFGAPATVTVANATASASTTVTLNSAPSTPIMVGDYCFIAGVLSGKVVPGGTYAGGTGTGTVILDTAVTVSAAAVIFVHPTRLLLLAIDNAGTIEAALVNQACGLNLDESGLISTTAISAGATSATTIYSTNARSNVPYKVVGYIDVVQATNGVYAVAPIVVQGTTAAALALPLGHGQTWQDVASKRVAGQTYINTSGRAIQVNVTSFIVNTGTITLTVDSIVVAQMSIGIGGGPNANLQTPLIAIVPPGSTYLVSSSVQRWAELR